MGIPVLQGGEDVNIAILRSVWAFVRNKQPSSPSAPEHDPWLDSRLPAVSARPQETREASSPLVATGTGATRGGPTLQRERARQQADLAAALMATTAFQDARLGGEPPAPPR